MKYRLYQIDPDRDHDRVRFLGLAVIEKYQGTPEVNRSIYEMVYEGELSEESDSIEKTLEDLFFRFNCRLPDDFRSRRMSVSDVVEVIGENGAESSFWYCDNVGFKQIPFKKNCQKGVT